MIDASGPPERPDSPSGAGPVRPAPGLDELRAHFREPSPGFSPVPLWWWSGEALDPARLRWQLERFAEGGVFNLVVINLAPTGPLYGNPADEPPFMSERWWEIFLGVCAHARDLGIRLWFYDQIGFSGANIQGRLIEEHPGFGGQTLERVSAIFDGPGTVTCPPGGRALAASWTPVDGSGGPSGPPEPVPLAGDGARWDGGGNGARGRLSLFHTAPRGFDYLNPDACASLIDTVHGEFERRAGAFFGDVIVGSFQDELPHLPRWNDRFAEAFAAAHGYALPPELEALWEDCGDLSQRVRHDYQVTRAALGEAAFFKPLFVWHDQRGLVCGVDQQGPARQGDPIGGVGIYADYMRTHRWFGAPGSDHHGEAKIHSSLAHLYGRPRVWIEAFHSSGWGGTLEETFDWLLPWLRAGANLYDPHASYYSTRGGWFEWAPPSTDWRQPYWRHYRPFADAVSRLCETLSAGDHVCDLAVLYPAATVQSGVGFGGASPEAEAAATIYRALVGGMVWFDQRPGVLDELKIDYDIVDDDSLLAATVYPGSLRIGGERYRTVILPGATVLETGTAQRLLSFIEEGGSVIAIGNPPSRLAAAGDPGDRGVIAALAERFASGAAAHIADPGGLGDLLAGDVPLVDAPVPTLVRVVGDATLVFVPAAFPRASTVEGHLGRIDFDRERYAREMTVRVRDVTGDPELWEPFSGATGRVLPTVRHEDGVEVVVPFDDGPGVVLVWTGEATASAGSAVANGRREIAQLDGPWACELEPTLDNCWGDFTRPASQGRFPIERWTFDHRRDADPEDAWAPGVATFGPRAVWAGPASAGELANAAPPTVNWRTLAWSASRGIHKDPLHRREPIGPSGHVPEEFLHFGPVEPGRAVRVRSRLLLDRDLDGWLAIGSAAAKRVWIDGAELTIDPGEDDRYLTMAPVRLAAGAHELDLMLTASGDGNLRASIAVTTAPDRYRRPERIVATDEPRADTILRYATTIVVEDHVRVARIQVGASAPCRILIDEYPVGRQGGFMPYGDYNSIHPYDIGAHLTPGTHRLVLEVQDLGRPAPVLVDGVIRGPDAERWIMTDATWTVTRDGAPGPIGIERSQRNDPAVAFIRQRPHPLPGARWLEGAGADDGTVAPVTFADPEGSGVEWIRFVTPPGAVIVAVPIVGTATAWLDGDEIEPLDDNGTGSARFGVHRGDGPPRECVIRIETEPGFSGGAVLTGPATYETTTGTIALGDWCGQGLTDYSGAVRYRREIEVPGVATGDRVWLDLGEVRGTAEVSVSGEPVGVRVLHPYRFELTETLRERSGRVALEILVTNTLGPYLDAVSPTPFVLDGQKVSGLFGPVRLLLR